MSLKINERFQAEQRELTAEEFAALEESIKANGIIDPIIVWNGWIIDGHHRNKIATKLGIDTPIRLLTFDDEDAAVEWIVNFQLSRRNLSPHDFKLKLGRAFNLAKARIEKAVPDRSPQGQFVSAVETQGKPQKVLAEANGVSTKKVERSGKYAAAFEKLTDGIKEMIAEKPSRATEACVIAMSQLDRSEQIHIAREVRVGNANRFDDVVKTPKQASKSTAKPSTNGHAVLATSPEKPPAKSPAKKLTAKQLATSLISQHVGPLIRGLDQLAKMNGGKGRNHKSGLSSAGCLSDAIKTMGGGEK